MLILDKIAVGDLFVSRGGLLAGVVEEPKGDKLSLLTEGNEDIVLGAQELMNNFYYLSKGNKERLEWCLM